MTTITKTDTDDEQTETDEEYQHARRTDITDGGLIGAVGGGIVGALAGGPIGAVIGAVVGASASAVAVEAIDNADHKAEIEYSLANEIEDYTIVQTIGIIDDDGLSGSIDPQNELYIFKDVPESDLIKAPTFEDQTRYRAYELWELRGHRHGNADGDWYDAETEVLQQQHAATGIEDPNNLEEVEDVVGYSS